MASPDRLSSDLDVAAALPAVAHDSAGGRITLLQVSLPGEPVSAGTARALLRDALTAADRTDWLSAGELALSEIATNAVLHAHTDLVVTVEIADDQLFVAVRDFSPVLPVQRHYDNNATTGRGLALVAALSDDHGISDAGPDGKTVWFTLSGSTGEQDEAALLATWGDAEWDLDGLLDEDETSADADGSVPAPTRTVHLLQLPPTLWLAARQHHDAIIRELTLYLAQHPDMSVDIASADRARAAISTAVVDAVEQAQGVDAQRQRSAGPAGPLPQVAPPLDLELTIPVELAPAFGVLQDTLDTAERLAQEGLLLARPALPEIIAVRDWACESITAQFHGVTAEPWAGTDQEHFTRQVHGRVDDASLTDHELDAVRDADRGVAAADESNRIVAISRPLAQALGWEVDELVGRRVVTLIPPHLREQHVAGFTRHLTSGEAVVLDMPLTLPVLHRDGSLLQANFMVQKAPTAGDRAVYLAWIEPIGTTSDS